jgi:CubicO group peptidase (beta-lactamase class C family)
MNAKHWAFGLASFCLLSGPAHAGRLPPPVAKQVDKVFADWSKPDSPGCALGVYQDGRIVYARGYGMADLNEGVPITPATVFHVASMSKQFTAASIILLAQQGKLSLDDDVHKYIPALPDFGEPITLRELMHHTSGLRDQWALLDLAGWRYSQDLITDDDVMSVVTRQKQLNFKPGEKYLYSNTGFTLLGLVVKRVSGLSLREFTSKSIFEPLGMTSTHFRDDHAEIIKHDAVGYARAGKDKPFRISITNFDTVGATSLHTTVEDLQKWDENFYRPRVGGPAFVRQMLEQAKLNSGEQIEYASGLQITKYRGLPTVDHGGADAGYRSDMRRFPKQHFTATVLCNAAEANPSRLVRQVADIMLAKDLSPAPSLTKPVAAGNDSSVSADLRASLPGLYWSAADDDFVRVAVKGEALEIAMGSDDPHPLASGDPGHLRFAYATGGEAVDVQPLAPAGGKPRRLVLTSPGGKAVTFDTVTPSAPTSAELADFTGPYVSDEIDPVYRIAVKDGALTLMRLKNDPDKLRPMTRDVFVGDIGTVRFTRDSNQHVTGFVLDAGRIQNFQFKRQKT